MGDIYRDMTFSMVNFNVTGLTPQPNLTSNEPNQFEDQITPPDASQVVDRRLDLRETGMDNPSQLIGIQDKISQPIEQPSRSESLLDTLTSISVVTESNLHIQDRLPLSVDQTSSLTPSEVSPATHEVQIQESASVEGFSDTNNITGQTRKGLYITTEKRNELFSFIAGIQPLHNTPIDADAPHFSLVNIQTYLNLFLEYFNDSYPIVHVATLNFNGLDSSSLWSMIIIGATYKDKVDHQLSVYLYDLIVPYILSGVPSLPTLELSTLQALLILECYGMYKAGPKQRGNAIVIHSLILDSIRKTSRYSVTSRITIPDQFKRKEDNWPDFAYTEQYKRLILYFFIWDTQNAIYYSRMPNISIQSLHISLPCSSTLWEAPSESRWKDLRTDQNEFYILPMVEKLLHSDHELLSKPYNNLLSFTVSLHGLMSMCNNMTHFDNQGIYFGSAGNNLALWTPWRQQMAQSFESWRAKYDAFLMEAVPEIQAQQALHNDFQRDTLALFSLYHTSHIVINCEIRHLQAAAGAKEIFGDIVTASDYKESCTWARNWVTSPEGSAGRAAWHAAQMLRAGMVNLRDWDVHSVFHYPWCLYIATLTCWAFHHFGAEPLPKQKLCDHSSPEAARELQESARSRMNHLVSMMAFATASNMDRTLGKCCTHGLTLQMAKYLRRVRWTVAYEAMKVLEGL
ncbi:hypothetical protein BP5796_12787 [Coleophoma crateriformis]|uniref:Xylanolytic transcriptional activator regulatory domain-containing protein n=1 Tax=Coleophoma crateriformis TaxID=565419 RepID=A0A3D8Q6M7_9HELO|nr:hypothetical protein BP5796_12787 [Coleophoma crateriformis]